MRALQCLTCGFIVTSNENYYKHNMDSHSLHELSLTLLKIWNELDTTWFPVATTGRELMSQNDNKMDISRKSAFSRECMDEVIELGPIEGADNLTIQSLFLKSNSASDSSHIIEVKEKKTSKNALKILSEELNAVVVHFQKGNITSDCSRSKPFVSTKKISSDTDDSKLEKTNTPESILKVSSVAHSDTLKEKTTVTKLGHSLPKKSKKKKKNIEFNLVDDLQFTKSESTKYLSPEKAELLEPICEKVILRSGRTIKPKPKDDFIYFDNYKDNSLRNFSHCQTSSKRPKNCNSSKLNKEEHISTLPESSVHFVSNNCDLENFIGSTPLESFNNQFLDLFCDWNLNNELDISIENLDLPGFEDLEGILPENQILTIENLLQELDGGGSIEISNIIKENNIDSDTVVLDALSQAVPDKLISQTELGVPNNNSASCTKKFAALSEKPEEVITTGNDLERQNNSNMIDNEISTSGKNVPLVVESDRNKCQLCNKQYVHRIRFLKHMKKYHYATNWMKYKCSTCGKSFGFLSSFEKHLKEHNPNQKFICELCGRQFKSLVNMKIHFALHSKQKAFKCSLCPKEYYLKYSYTTHLKSHDNRKAYKCDKCEKAFYQKTHFKRHLQKHKNGKYLGISEDLKCNNCSDKKSLQDLPEQKQNITCLKCQKGFYRRYLLKNTSYTNEVDEQPKIKNECKVCGKMVNNLKKHIWKIHLSNPVVQCDICAKSIKKSSLNSHMHRKHEGTPVSCDHCGKFFKNIFALHEHVKCHT